MAGSDVRQRGPTVTDLPDRVQAAIGHAYEIERELGGGGMSRIYLARERELDRWVVVKVLPPELAGVVNLERFRRETQLAASLQHPHIVPLLTAGNEDGLFYYIMPYVEGESLRRRLDREHRLPVPEAVRILREVADALASAHRRGVVHRDIKPGNVLMLDGHAVVTDFGVAKSLLSDGEETADLTTKGLAIGTPAYMAPEQAAADPNTDHRADLYALGAMGYELLAGRPPFTGMSPAAVLAAHLTTPPEPLSRYRPDVPPAVADAIERCLEKKPDDRWQTAEEFRDHLESVVTPGEGTLTRGFTLRRHRGLGQHIHSLGVPTALVGYGLGAAAVAFVLRSLVRYTGVPEWILPGGIALLAVGFAIMVLAALGRIPWLTRRGALVGGAAAFGLLALAAGGYLGLRAAGIGPMGSLVGAGKLGLRDRVLIADFENRSEDPLLGEVVTEAFRTDLTQSPVVSVVQPSVIRETLARMQQSDEGGLGFDLAREVAVRDGIKAVIAGDIAMVGQQVVLSARLVAPESGDVLAAFRETAPDSTAIIGAIDRLSKRMRERIGESLQTIRSNSPMADVTTTSLEALRKYTMALRAAELDGDQAKAVSLLEEAIRADSGFAMAWRKLGVMLWNQGQDPRKANAAFTRAFELRDRLSERERLLAEASYYWQVKGDQAKGIEAYEALLAVDPSNWIALNNLGVIYTDRRDYAQATRYFARASEGDSVTPYRFALLAATQLEGGDTTGARETLVRMARRFPGNPQVGRYQALMDAVALNYDAAEALLRKTLASFDGPPSMRGDLMYDLSSVTRVHGRFTEAARLRQDALELGAGKMPDDATVNALNQAMESAVLQSWLLGQPDRAIQTLNAALTRNPLDSIEVGRRPYVQLAEVYALSGRPDRAKAMLAERERILAALPADARPRPKPEAESAELVALGDISLAQGQSDSAVVLFRRAQEVGGPTMGLPELGMTFQRLGQTDSARVVYERYLRTPTMARLGGDAFYVPLLYARLAELYERTGDRARAAEYYGKLADLYRQSDPELKPMLQKAKDGLARVTGEPAVS